MKSPRILATSGGLIPGPIQQTWKLGTLLLDALSMTEKVRPRVTYLATATGDMESEYARHYQAFGDAGCEVTALRLFPQPSANFEEAVLGADLVWVGGGSVANLLALWELHGLDNYMRTAWEQGVIMGGRSAGSLCWFTGGNTDSYSNDLDPVTNGLSLLPYANSVHYSGEPRRRETFQNWMKDGTLPSLGYATDDRIGIWFEGLEPTTVVSDIPVDPQSGPAAYKVELLNGEITETRFGFGSSF